MQRVSGIRRVWLLAAAAALIAGGAMPAAAADLGGDCCTDLEDRIAELEATAARKGNRKVSLMISGWVNEEIALWDDGTERNAYIGTSPVQQSRFKFLGEAKIDKDWSAGYLLEIGVNGYPGGQWDQTGPSSTSAKTPSNGLTVRRSSWFLKNSKWGRVLVGQDAVTTYHLLAESDTTMTRKIYHDEGAPDFQAKFFVRDKSGNFVNAGGICVGVTSCAVTTTRRRATAVAAILFATTRRRLWASRLARRGEKMTFGIRLSPTSAASATSRSTVEPVTATRPMERRPLVTPCLPPATMRTAIGGACRVSFNTTRQAFSYLPATASRIDNARAEAALQPGLVDKTDTTWFVQAGIEHKWLSFGKTNFFGQYRHDDAGSDLTAGGALRTQEGNVDFWTVGAIQHLEAADAMLYVIYQHADGDVVANVTDSGLANVEFDTLQQVVAGMRIAF